jgi:Cache domain
MLGIVIVSILSFLSMSSYVLYLPNANAQKNDNNTINLHQYQSIADKVTIAKVLANSLGHSLNNSAAHLKVTSMLPEVGNAQYADKINSSLHGIANDVDVAKRKIADAILKADDDFAGISFLLPNGDMYMQEPYWRQLNLTENNFAFRDYFKGAVETKDAFLGNMIVSKASGKRVSVIAMPIYSDKNGSLIGIWMGALDFSVFDRFLQSLHPLSIERIVYVDSHGQKVADSNSQLSKTPESFANLLSFKDAASGKSGYKIEVVNNTKMFVAYSSTKILSNTWTVLLLEPYSQVQ